MRFNPELHHRHSLRLHGYDYTQAGAYFVTICTQHKACVLGEIVGGEMQLTTGRMVQRVWNDMPQYYLAVDVDAFVVMPNHIHGIIVLTVGAGLRACPTPGRPQGVAPTMSLPMVVHRFKSLTTTWYRRELLAGRLWQRNYYEHIIHDEEELNRIRNYIVNNPLQWELDRENPAVTERKKPAESWQV
jgi:REP element-mobilizing transposase RayT